MATTRLISISARNQLKGIVEEIKIEGLLAQVRLRVGDQVLTAVITRDAVQDLQLERGGRAVAVVKATEVMIAKEVE
jgi:molybdopterin-binding protein